MGIRKALSTPVPRQHPSLMKLLQTLAWLSACEPSGPKDGLRTLGKLPTLVQPLKTPKHQNQVGQSQESLFYLCLALPQGHQNLSHKDSGPRSFLDFCLKPPSSLGSERKKKIPGLSQGLTDPSCSSQTLFSPSHRLPLSSPHAILNLAECPLLVH